MKLKINCNECDNLYDLEVESLSDFSGETDTCPKCGSHDTFIREIIEIDFEWEDTKVKTGEHTGKPRGLG